MTCVDPEEVERFEQAGDTSSAAFRDHVARCGDCSALYAAVGGLARAADAHPAASALAAFDEQPSSLSETSRAWIAAHVARCGSCREALRAVPPLGPALETRRLRLLPILTAAGWLLAAVLVVREARPGREADPVLATQTITLSQARGGSETRIQDVEVVRFSCVLAEEVKPGQALHVRIEDASGRPVVEADVAVHELDDSGWPVVAFRRSSLPAGRMTIRVRAPSGSEIAATVGG
jgi:hypothetical protein